MGDHAKVRGTHKPNEHFSEETIQAILKDFRDGMDVRSVALKYKCSSRIAYKYRQYVFDKVRTYTLGERASKERKGRNARLQVLKPKPIPPWQPPKMIPSLTLKQLMGCR